MNDETLYMYLLNSYCPTDDTIVNEAVGKAISSRKGKYSYVYFSDNPRQFGDSVADAIAEKLKFVEAHHRSYDKWYRGYKFEIKSVTAKTPTAPGSIELVRQKDMKTKSFQQTKPSRFDFIVCAAVYCDEIAVFLVPSHHIHDAFDQNTAKPLAITKQHDKTAGGTGHLSFGKILNFPIYTVGFLDDENFEETFIKKMGYFLDGRNI